MLVALLPLLAMSSQSLYNEPLRPQFHFTAQKGWLNDPNGLVFFKGEYHLFFQHNPFGTQWGNMTWGHAVSKDMVHWKQVGHALEPDALGTMFSGSAVVDRDRLVCIYTAAGGTNEASKGKPFTQCMATSTDGRTFAKLATNPVLEHIEAENRDPKVIWHEPTKRWVMALYLNESRYALFSSPDLMKWERLSNVEIPGASECPDFFPLLLDGDERRAKWVFWGGNGRYRVGAFDGKAFTPETEAIESNFGNTAYAAQTFFNDPKGRRVQIAWFRGSEFPGAAWNQQMGFPTSMSLRSTSDGPRLVFQPVKEIESLRVRKVPLVHGRTETTDGLVDATVEATIPDTGALTVRVNGHEVRVDASSRTLYALDKQVRLPPGQKRLKLRMLADRASVEIFAQDGLITMPFYTLPPAGSEQRFGVSTSGEWKLEKAEVWELKSAWER